MDLDGHHVGLAPGQQLEIRQQPRGDGVGNQAGDPLHEGKRVSHASDVPAPILHPDEHHTTRRIGEGDDRAKKSLGRGQVALEFEGLALRVAEGIEEVHS
jgi:hypothetical protein